MISRTMLPSGYVHILAESGMSDSLEDLKASQDFDGVGGEREAVAPTHIMRESGGKEGEGPQLSVFEGPHPATGLKLCKWERKSST